ncbi:hypothetical protein EXIGLDRAFT_728498 [Exidia glandulosa HHB12029]|uniref:C2H2-type domain-containing protein n=1 Tax=Exidia glandulosa HHB12029 TaxID=1314781 RepID=A0A165CWK1_EXIGL|nr:hypothetical protein EXIGLDRAFT_728498 [Exidia glandulosa HHB12029]
MTKFCDRCTLSFPRTGDLDVHKYREHPLVANLPTTTLYRCHCGCVFSDEERLTEHKSKKHSLARSIINHSYGCCYLDCGFAAARAGPLLEHWAQHGW